MPILPVVTHPDPALQEKRAGRWTLKDIHKYWILKQETLLQDSDATVRADAAWRIGFEAYLYNRPPKPELHAARDALLLTLANDPDAAVRSNAAWGLGQLGPATPEVLTTLLSTLRDDPDAPMRSNPPCCSGPLPATPPHLTTPLHPSF